MSYITSAKVIQVIDHNDLLKEYVLEIEKSRKYNPGSFVQLTLESVSASDIWPESRTFSIASYEDGIMRFIIKNSGDYTSRIFKELLKDSSCTIKYPFGDLFDNDTVDENHLLIAGGIGVTPFLSIVRYFEIMGKLSNISMFYSARHIDDFIHLDYFKKALEDRLYLFLTREECEGFNNHRVRLEDVYKIADYQTNIYICGSKDFNNSLKHLLSKNGYSKIHMDEWE